MQILIVGGGGREHAIAWKLSQSPRVDRLWAAPGNAGIAKLAECVDLAATDLDGITAFARQQQIDLVFVAPDDPLALGLVDRLEAQGIRAFGPRKKAARIESSKAYAKKLMQSQGIPTARHAVYSDLDQALAAIEDCHLPIVVKADGLALGKGVIIAETRDEARQAVSSMLQDQKFGAAGQTIVLEEFLQGPELTVLAFTDGKTVRPMLSSRDHKRAYDQDQGPNTGGMGAVVPGADLSPAQLKQMQTEIFEPTIAALRQAQTPFKGVIYFGLMLTAEGPKVIEYNARLGDPEAQAVLPLLKTDLLEIIEAIETETLAQLTIEWQKACSCCVVAASGGYPLSYEKGFAILGLSAASQHGIVFHAGTALKQGEVVTSGGRVLGVTAIGETLPEAIRKAYQGMECIHFENMHVRKDIGL